MTVREIAQIIENFAPLDTQESWDNSGLCIGSPSKDVHGVLVGLDCTPALVQEAITLGADMIVTHHPLIFRGIKSINPDTVIGRTITLAIAHSIAVYSAHTNADKAEGGVTAIMADTLGLEDIRPLDESGLALIGTLSTPMESLDFIDEVRDSFRLRCLRTSAPIEWKVRKVALCAGSGSSFIDKAYQAGADALVTGDVTYHHFFCNEGMMILDIGHFESEIAIVSKLKSVLQENIPNFAVHSTEVYNNNPIYYY